MICTPLIRLTPLAHEQGYISFANSVDTDQRAPVGAFWSGATLYVIFQHKGGNFP